MVSRLFYVFVFISAFTLNGIAQEFSIKQVANLEIGNGKSSFTLNVDSKSLEELEELEDEFLPDELDENINIIIFRMNIKNSKDFKIKGNAFNISILSLAVDGVKKKTSLKYLSADKYKLATDGLDEYIIFGLKFQGSAQIGSKYDIFGAVSFEFTDKTNIVKSELIKLGTIKTFKIEKRVYPILSHQIKPKNKNYKKLLFKFDWTDGIDYDTYSEFNLINKDGNVFDRVGADSDGSVIEFEFNCDANKKKPTEVFASFSKWVGYKKFKIPFKVISLSVGSKK